MKLRTKIISGCSALALVGSIAAVTTAAVPDSDDNEYHACLSNSSSLKTAFIIDKQAGTTCSTGYSEKTWFKNGTPGPAGPVGPAGPAGPAGEDGAGLGPGAINYNGTISESVDPGERREVFSYCGEDGEFSPSGGARISPLNPGTPGDTMEIQESDYAQRESDNRAGWRIVFKAASGNQDPLDIFVFTTCLNVSGD